MSVAREGPSRLRALIPNVFSPEPGPPRPRRLSCSLGSNPLPKNQLRSLVKPLYKVLLNLLYGIC